MPLLRPIFPLSLGGLNSRTGEDPRQSVSTAGATLIALPLRREIAGPLRRRLRESATAQETEVGPCPASGLWVCW